MYDNHRVRRDCAADAPQVSEAGGSFFRDDEQAADAVQEALLRLWLLRERVNDEDYAEALLIRMTKNVCVSE